MSADVPISVVVPTLNEEGNIDGCLASVAFAAERVVFDSFSTDATLERARAAGARVVQRRFDVFSRHKNWAIENIDFAHDWVMFLDADERVPPELAAEIATAIAAERPKDGYYVARRNVFRGRWIRHGGMYPDWQLRLFRRGRARYEDRIVHEHMILDGQAGYLRNPLLHQDFKGIERYIARHNHYSSLEAIAAHFELHGDAGEQVAPDLFSRGPGRRRALKRIAYRYLPFRPAWVFLYMFVVRLGFLDRRQGWHYSVLRAIYEYQVSLKLAELKDPASAMSRLKQAIVSQQAESVTVVSESRARETPRH